jgi:hypothetical protein
MIEWLVVRAEHRETVGNALARAWRGGERGIRRSRVPAERASRFVWSAGAQARRAARWPDLLTDWHDIYEDALFPGDAIRCSPRRRQGWGPSAHRPRRARAGDRVRPAGTARATSTEYEHVGSAQIAWNPEDGLGRPFDGTSRTMSAMAARRFASLIGPPRPPPPSSGSSAPPSRRRGLLSPPSCACWARAAADGRAGRQGRRRPGRPAPPPRLSYMKEIWIRLRKKWVLPLTSMRSSMP